MAFTLDVTKALKNPGQAYPFQAALTLPEMEVLSDPVRFNNINVEGEFLCTGERISMKATVEGQVLSRCAKCLEPVQLPIKAEIDALFARQPDPEDPDQYSFEASTLELTDAVKDALLLELPMRFLCSEDCKGLCPHCGVNLNRGSCTCQEGGEVTNPFSALKAIVQNNEEV